MQLNADHAQLDQIRAIPFVRRLRLVPSVPHTDSGYDGTLEITTAGGDYKLSLIRKRSYLDRSLMNALIGRIQGEKKAKNPQHSRTNSPVLVFTPYLPATTAKSFIDAGISFADEVGNIHLALGDEYNWTVIGERKPPKAPESERITPAAVQLLFQFATTPDSAKWTVRDLATAAGISKSKVAQLRAQFVHDRLLIQRRGEEKFQITPALKESLASGYSQVLRPKILLGRFRHADKTTEDFLTRLRHAAIEHKIAYALTGGPAADALLHLYRTPDVPLFVRTADAATLRNFRLIPDRQGPVTLLRAFAPLVFWREVEGTTVAPLWLIYAELLTGVEDRDRRVAEELRQKLLP
jgi:hypothetical protein